MLTRNWPDPGQIWDEVGQSQGDVGLEFAISDVSPCRDQVSTEAIVGGISGLDRPHRVWASSGSCSRLDWVRARDVQDPSANRGNRWHRSAGPLRNLHRQVALPHDCRGALSCHRLHIIPVVYWSCVGIVLALDCTRAEQARMCGVLEPYRLALG